MVSLDISFKNFSPEEKFDVEAFVYKKARRLNVFQDSITSLCIVFDSPIDSHGDKCLYCIELTLSISGKQISLAADSQNPYLAVDNVFQIAYERLQKINE